MNWTATDFWIDKKWLKESNLRYLDIKRYDDWVANAPAGSKPWIIMFGDTFYGSPAIVQTNENMFRNMACLSKLYADRFNVGFMDFRKSEKVFDAYDSHLQFGMGAPFLMVIKDGKAYHAAQGSIRPHQIVDLVEKPEEVSSYVESLKESRSELTIFWEYAKKDVGKHPKLGDLTR